MRRKPPDQQLLTAIRRIQIFSAAFQERHVLQQVQAKVKIILPREMIQFHDPRDQRVLEYMMQLAQRFPEQLEGSSFPGILLLILWLAECRAAELGYLLEGEVNLPYPAPDQQAVYKAPFPKCLYPATCLSCGKALSQRTKEQTFCQEHCRASWLTLKEQFTRLSQLSRQKQSVVDDYGTLLMAYTLLIHHPHYGGFEPKNPEAYELYQSLYRQGTVCLYQNQQEQPVDLQGNLLPEAYRITDLEELLA